MPPQTFLPYFKKPTPEKAGSWNFQQVCHYLNVGKDTLKRLVREGYIESFRIPGKTRERTLIRFRRDEVFDFIRRNREIPPRLPDHWIDPTRTDLMPVVWAKALFGDDFGSLPNLKISTLAKRIGRYRGK